MCLWAAATEAAPRVGKAQTADELDDVEEFESELDAMVVEGDAPSEEHPSPRRLRYHGTGSRYTAAAFCSCMSTAAC